MKTRMMRTRAEQEADIARLRSQTKMTPELSARLAKIERKKTYYQMRADFERIMDIDLSHIKDPAGREAASNAFYQMSDILDKARDSRLINEAVHERLFKRLLEKMEKEKLL